jgi:dCTP deaminase
MAFWSSSTLRERVLEERLIVPYDPARVKHCAYEMGVGREAYITSVSKEKTRVPPDEKIIIPPGQFGLLTTQEVVKVPIDAIAFISIRAGIKFRGLVNVSGFHVDPGFEGHLKFAVYNAGSQPVVLDQKQPAFMIWYSELDDVVDDPYQNKKRGRNIITSEDVARIQGEVASPAELKKRLDELKVGYDQKILAIEKEQNIVRGLLIAVVLAVVGVWIRDLVQSKQSEKSAPVASSELPNRIEKSKGESPNQGLQDDLQKTAPPSKKADSTSSQPAVPKK